MHAISAKAPLDTEFLTQTIKQKMVPSRLAATAVALATWLFQAESAIALTSDEDHIQHLLSSMSLDDKIDLVTGELVGFEMLARWVSPVRGLISPDDFIPVAEETGMIGDLSMSIIRKAMLEAKNWDPKLTISVNISPVQLKDPWLAQKIVKLLVESP